MRCSIGVLELPAGLVIDDVSRISGEIAELKKLAKENAEGVAIGVSGDS